VGGVFVGKAGFGPGEKSVVFIYRETFRLIRSIPLTSFSRKPGGKNLLSLQFV